MLSNWSITSWNDSSSHILIRVQSSQLNELPATKQHKMSSDPNMPTTPWMKNVKATPNDKRDSWSMSLDVNRL